MTAMYHVTEDHGRAFRCTDGTLSRDVGRAEYLTFAEAHQLANQFGGAIRAADDFDDDYLDLPSDEDD